ncbi:uncharacterized protein EURHEDRAFT_408774 [Aspergillus ruber CBS 135680]|uniref:Uncharacterized protein n=1 Tax=Aspergillus ruber (strain CBS 135680) TaxID=1388766 RepID=A0A017SN77_ASPRC|nr:uncharacterized protein EURHEDRAFT_408774 [Aspergillus ruber CBS 135680]EYE98433.1 hypothetical protein EURHEDRAFT_408774 [Aspergillus ruber CBS 135680]
MSLFTSKEEPFTVTTDTIISLHFRDDIQLHWSLAVDCILRFNDILDAKRLRHSLDRLLELGGVEEIWG